MSKEISQCHIDPRVIPFVRHLQKAEQIFQSSSKSTSHDDDIIEIQNMFDRFYMIFYDISEEDFSYYLRSIIFSYDFPCLTRIIFDDQHHQNEFCFHLHLFLNSLSTFCTIYHSDTENLQPSSVKIATIIDDLFEFKTLEKEK